MADSAFGEVGLALLGVTGGEGRAAEGNKDARTEYHTQYCPHSFTSLTVRGLGAPSGHRTHESSPCSRWTTKLTKAAIGRKARNCVMMTPVATCEVPLGSGTYCPLAVPMRNIAIVKGDEIQAGLKRAKRPFRRPLEPRCLYSPCRSPTRRSLPAATKSSGSSGSSCPTLS